MTRVRACYSRVHGVRTEPNSCRVKQVLSAGERAGIRTLDLLIKSQVLADSSGWMLMPGRSKHLSFHRVLWISHSRWCLAFDFSGYLLGA
jgi:hypothetical protein